MLVFRPRLMLSYVTLWPSKVLLVRENINDDYTNMRTMNVVTLFTAYCLVPVLAQTKYCCTASQWESANTFLQGSTNGTSVVFVTGTESVSVDGNAHKIASTSFITAAGQLASYKIIQDFDKGIQYTVLDLACSKKQLPAWTPRCVPDDAKLLTTTYFGVGDSKLDVDVYGVTVGNNTVFLDIGKADCSPLYVASYGTTDGVGSMSVKTYGNYTLGIKDMSVFDVPDSCNKAQLAPHVPSSNPHDHGLY